jgi:hypothetical protein
MVFVLSVTGGWHSARLALALTHRLTLTLAIDDSQEPVKLLKDQECHG